VAALLPANPPADAPAEVDTPSQEPTAEPTATFIPASPTPSRIEFSVQNDRFEVRVVEVERPTHVNPGGGTVFTPGEGYMFLGLGIKVTNLTGADVPLKWSDIYLINKYQDKWYPMWGAYQKTNKVLDPLTVEILEFEVHPEIDPDANIFMSDNGYLRAIYRLPKDNLYYYFGFADLPLIEINYRYH
jgi:hypothetical protein